MNADVRMTPKPLFNPEGSRDPGSRRILGGSTTNLLELNQCGFPWADSLYRKMRSYFWVPEEIPLGDDAQQFVHLTPAERKAYLSVLSFLIFLDSIQIDNVGALAAYVTAPEINACLRTQSFFESIHAQSYDYILTSVVDSLTRDHVYTLWRDDERLKARNAAMIDRYERFRANPTPENFIRSCMADLLLEGIYFYSGFAFFFTLGRQQKMGGTVSVIRTIRRDEILHLALFTQMMRSLRQEIPECFTPAMEEELLEMARRAVEEEIAWGQHVTQNQILGLTDPLIDRYIRYLGNQRCQAIGLPQPYPEVTQDPMPWIEGFAALNQVKTDFFERRVLNYRSRADKIRTDDLRERLQAADSGQTTASPIEDGDHSKRLNFENLRSR